MIVACDVDGVVADLLPEWLRRYNRDYGDDLTPERITDWGIDRFVKPECGDLIMRYLCDATLYGRVAPVEGALWGVEALRDEGHEVIFTTSCHPGGSYEQKLCWLRDRGFIRHHDEMVAIGNKSLIAADIMIDDGGHNVTRWVAQRHRPAVLFSAPHNQHVGTHHLIRRVATWQEVVMCVEEINVRGWRP